MNEVYSQFVLSEDEWRDEAQQQLDDIWEKWVNKSIESCPYYFSEGFKIDVYVSLMLDAYYKEKVSFFWFPKNEEKFKPLLVLWDTAEVAGLVERVEDFNSSSEFKGCWGYGFRDETLNAILTSRLRTLLLSKEFRESLYACMLESWGKAPPEGVEICRVYPRHLEFMQDIFPKACSSKGDVGATIRYMLVNIKNEVFEYVITSIRKRLRRV